MVAPSSRDLNNFMLLDKEKKSEQVMKIRSNKKVFEGLYDEDQIELWGMIFPGGVILNV